ncbi:efflux RND transporter periplasmic adaptor subunit [Bosea sp. (in: a-proteobacteria)]|jgi:multidrug efflux system membrane fusion protein|uniref:efflux RND transporter periplasmic adaptor subunit n=1 Tax=Bosea sp. (in: a-proteobacteria) TaxID=1871050 RepID=UPI003F706D1F
MTRSRLLWTALVLVAAATAAGLWFRQPLQGASSRNGDPQAAGATATRGGDAPVSVITAKATTGDVPVRKRAIGFVETPASVVVKSRLDSQIMTQHFEDGQFVKAGDLLFTLDDRDLRVQLAKDQAALARDEATHARTQADLARNQQLLAKNAGTQQAVDQAIADEKSAAATVLADQATLQADTLKLSYARVTSPIDGRAGAVQVAAGNLVGANSAGTGLVTITQMKPIRVSFTLPEREVPMLQAALAAGKALTVTAKAPDSDRPPEQGTLNFVDSSVDTASGTIVAKAAFANDDLSLWPGQYVDVEVQADTLIKAVTVPTVAVQVGQKGSYVYVVKADDTVDLRQVKVALADGDRTVIAEGVADGERVVTDGQMRLKPGAKARERQSPATSAPAVKQDNLAQGGRS